MHLTLVRTSHIGLADDPAVAPAGVRRAERRVLARKDVLVEISAADDQELERYRPPTDEASERDGLVEVEASVRVDDDPLIRLPDTGKGAADDRLPGQVDVGIPA